MRFGETRKRRAVFHDYEKLIETHTVLFRKAPCDECGAIGLSWQRQPLDSSQ